MVTSADIKKKIGQCFIIGFYGHEPLPEVKKFITDNDIGGVIHFDRNIQSPAQLADLNNSLQELRPKGSLPLFVSIDMEGGRVARLKAPFTQWPPMAILGELGSASLGFKFAETMGKELAAVGINMNYSPCVDIFTNPQNKVIGDRAFGIEPEIVAKLGSSVVRGFVKAGIIPCVKHFPGHGDTIADSHEELPIVNHDLETLENREFIPFKRTFRARADFLMTAHILCEKLDKENPATLSPYILQELLRKKLGYRNAIITDDMEMNAIFKNYEIKDAAVRAVLAGCTVLLYCHKLEVQVEALEAITKAVVDGKIPMAMIEQNYQMVQRIKTDFLSHYKAVDVAQMSKDIGHPEHLKLAKQIARKEIPEGLTT